MFFFIFIFTSTSIQGYNTNDTLVTYEEKTELAVAISDSFVGIKEKGNNQSFNNKHFERMMLSIGWYRGAPWCAFVLKLIYTLSDIKTTITGFSPSAYNKKHIIYTNGKLYEPIKPGDAGTLSYNKFKKDKNRYKGIGHAFIIKETYGKSAIITLEGNTDSDASREGNGFYRKIRPLQSNLHITRWDQ